MFENLNILSRDLHVCEILEKFLILSIKIRQFQPLDDHVTQS